MSEQRLRASLVGKAFPGHTTVHAVRGEERLGELYRYEVDLSADEVAFSKATGSTVLVTLTDDEEQERFVGGEIESLEVSPTDDEGATSVRCRLTVVPRAAVLAWRHGYRIHQDLDVPDIVRRVLKDAGVPEEETRWGLGRNYTVRKYCVQYDESELAFVRRLLEEEGIWFAFEHSADGVVMVFGDQSPTAPRNAPGEVVFIADLALHGRGLRLWNWHRRGALTPARVAMNDYDREHPSEEMFALATDDAAVGGLEWYEQPGHYDDLPVGQRRAQDRLESLRVAHDVVTADTNAITLSTARWLQVSGHPTDDAEWMVIGQRLHARIDAEDGDGALVDRGEPECVVTLEMIPKAKPFRTPRRTPWPRVVGLQTARVTGPSGQEIYCDALGRVKLQFHWDREGKLDEHTTCWVRVSQAQTTGSVAIPRIGWEVLVEFLDGDPDRPVCFGQVYNALFPPSYSLPAEKAVTGHKSYSLPGRAATNEVLLDDSSGAQRVAINGGHDINVVVAHDRMLNVGANATRTVVGKRAASVSGHESMSVEGSDSGKVAGDESITVGANRTVGVDQSATEEIVGAMSLSVGAMENLKVGSPAAAVLEIIQREAVAAAEGIAASAASRAQGALLGPMLPALNQARTAMGPVMHLAGPAAGLVRSPGAALAAEGHHGVAGADTPAGAQAASDAAGASAAIANGSMPPGGGAGGGGENASASNTAGGGGGGVWGTVVGGDVSESVGAIGLINSAYGVTFNVGGHAKDTIGAAKIELTTGSKMENTKGSKTEITGSYVLMTSGALSFDATAAMAVNVAGVLRQTIGGGHSMSAKGAAAVTGARMKVDAGGKITLKCGLSEIVVDSGGVVISGLNVTIEGSAGLDVTDPSIGPT